jgi:Zn-dependent membrane protease YugP
MLTFQPIYLLLVIPVFLGWFAQWRLQQVYYHYLQVPNKKGKNGMEIVQDLLSFYQLNLPVLQTNKKLLNYYNPQNRTLHLCKNIIESSSITSLGIVAHEVEHAVQEDRGFLLMNLRNRMAKPLAFMGQLSPLVFTWGILFRNVFLVYVGVSLLVGMVIFSLVSLPIEFNASKRALNTLQEVGLADRDEIKMVSVVLRHAAFTYLIGAAQRIGTFLFILLILIIIIRK